MSRFPGLQFPTSNSGQPQTRAQQRPGANLLQRFFALKGDKLARKGQKFQEDSFNEALEAYEGPDGALATYNREKTAWDDGEQQRYDEAKSIYDTQMLDYNAARSDYGTAIGEYQRIADVRAADKQAYDDTLARRQSLWDTAGSLTYGGGGWYYTNHQGQRVYPPPADLLLMQTPEGSIPLNYREELPNEIPSFTAQAPSFSASVTPFGSDVPSFNYTAPESPGAVNAEKLATMGLLADQLQGVLPENSRNRNRSPVSFYNTF